MNEPPLWFWQAIAGKSSIGIPDTGFQTRLRIHPHVGRSFRANPGPRSFRTHNVRPTPSTVAHDIVPAGNADCKDRAEKGGRLRDGGSPRLTQRGVLSVSQADTRGILSRISNARPPRGSVPLPLPSQAEVASARPVPKNLCLERENGRLKAQHRGSVKGGRGFAATADYSAATP